LVNGRELQNLATPIRAQLGESHSAIELADLPAPDAPPHADRRRGAGPALELIDEGWRESTAAGTTGRDRLDDTVRDGESFGLALCAAA